MSTDFENRREQHHARMAELNAELHGFIQGTCEGVITGGLDAEKALTQIRERTNETAAAIEASWNELLGGAS